MSNMYREIEKEVNEIAKNCEITDSSQIREMICERMQEKITEMGRELVDALNIMGGDVQEAVTEGLTTGITTSHPYLQGEFWGVMLKVINKYGKTKYFDARNEWAVKMCQRMTIAGEDPRTEEVLNKHIEDHKVYYEPIEPK